MRKPNIHATAVDWAPFIVTTQTPSNPPPTITSITPSNAAPGAQITIIGTGFRYCRQQQLRSDWQSSAQIPSVNPGGTQIVVFVPSNLSPGTVPVTVSSFRANQFTSNPHGDRERGALAGNQACFRHPRKWRAWTFLAPPEKTYRIEYVNPLRTNNWSALTNLFLSSSPGSWVDTNSAGQPSRFYRSVELP
jgi:hypothetical protein